MIVIGECVIERDFAFRWAFSPCRPDITRVMFNYAANNSEEEGMNDHKLADGKSAIAAAALAVATMLSPLAMPTAAEAANKGKFTASYCNRSGALCGAIVYANKGGYVVNPLEINAKGEQPSISSPINSECDGFKDRFASDLAVGDYVIFVVPADCAYRLKIKIVFGKSKDQNLFVTPGCQIEANTDGTTQQNEWHVKAKWTDDAKKNGASGDVVDANGYKCGRLGKIGSGTS